MVVTYRFGHIYTTKLLVIRAETMCVSCLYGWSYGHFEFLLRHDSVVIYVWPHHGHIMTRSQMSYSGHMSYTTKMWPFFDCSEYPPHSLGAASYFKAAETIHHCWIQTVSLLALGRCDTLSRKGLKFEIGSQWWPVGKTWYDVVGVGHSISPGKGVLIERNNYLAPLILKEIQD